MEVQVGDDGSRVLMIELSPGKFLGIGSDVMASWQELLGIEDEAEVVEVIIQTAESPTPAESPWPALYEAYDLRVQTEQRAGIEPAVQRKKEPEIGVAMFSALPQERLIDATESNLRDKQKRTREKIMAGKKPKKLEDRGIGRAELHRKVKDLGIQQHRESFRNEAMGTVPAQ